jgi:hypothetical protein
MALNHSPNIVTNNLLLSIDFRNPVNYTSGNSANSVVTTSTFSRTNPSTSYATYNSAGYITFSRLAGSATQAVKQTAGDQYLTTMTTAAAKPHIFLYSDFTWEVWFKPNDLNPSSYDATEGVSVVSVFRGWHQGFYYTASDMRFGILSATGPTFYEFIVSNGSNTLVQGNWHQVVVTRKNNLYTMYFNSVSRGTATYTPTPVSEGAYTSNDISIGGAKWTGGTADYCWWSKMDFSNMKMYNRALTAAEIAQNFDALRGRFGL